MLRVCRCGVVAVTSLRHVNGAVRWTVEGMGAGGDVEMWRVDSGAGCELRRRRSEAMDAPEDPATATAGAAAAPFRTWMTHVEEAVSHSDVEAVESLIAARRATHGVEACGAAERDAATCCMHESGSGRGEVVEVGAGRSRGDGGHACGAGAGGEASSLPPELVFKLKRLTVLSALRSGDVVRAHALTAAHLGPLAAEQPSLQSMLSVRSLTCLPHPTPPSSLPCSSLRACLRA